MKPLWILVTSVTVLAVLTVGGYFVYDLFLRGVPREDVKVPIGPTTSRASIPVPDVKFTDATAAAGITFKHFSGATGSKLLPETMGSGVVVLDYDNDRRPDLLFVNSMAWPGHPQPEQAPTLALYRNLGDGKFEDATVAAGLNVTLYGVGGCAGDFDNDGFTDLFITCVGGHKLFKNDGKRFTDITAKAGVAGPGALPTVASAEEFLKHAAPIPFGTSATFLDFDGDARLDLFVCHYCTWSPAIDLSIKSTLTGVGRTYQQPKDLEGNQCSLYRNKGDGTFEDVTASAGARVTESEGTDADAKQRPVGKSLGVILFDPDADGWPDLIVANDTVRNFFFHNVSDGRGGRKFVERGLESNIAYAEGGAARGAMGIDVGEYKPGKSAVLIANFANEPSSFLELSNAQRLLFQDTCAAVSLLGPSRGPLKFGNFFFDYDLDGRLDILMANGHIDPDITKLQPNQTYKQPAQLFWNTGDDTRVYEPVTPTASGSELFKPIVGRGSAYLDYDGDGDLDAVLTDNGGTPLLLRNDQKTGHHWLRLNLEGDGETSNRSAIGAEVTVEAGGQKYKRTITGARGYLSQSELTVTVGLGKTETVDKVTVRWPGKTATMQTWTGLKCDGVYRLKQGTAEAVR